MIGGWSELLPALQGLFSTIVKSSLKGGGKWKLRKGLAF